MWAQTAINPVCNPEWKWSIYQLYPRTYVINATIYKKKNMATVLLFVSTLCHYVGLHLFHLTLNHKVYITLFVCESVWGNIIFYACVYATRVFLIVFLGLCFNCSLTSKAMWRATSANVLFVVVVCFVFLFYVTIHRCLCDYSCLS